LSSSCSSISSGYTQSDASFGPSTLMSIRESISRRILWLSNLCTNPDNPTGAQIWFGLWCWNGHSPSSRHSNCLLHFGGRVKSMLFPNWWKFLRTFLSNNLWDLTVDSTSRTVLFEQQTKYSAVFWWFATSWWDKLHSSQRLWTTVAYILHPCFPGTI
jgi:hypothetical protein